MAEQYFQESMANLKDAEGTGKAKFLSIQDDYCHFLQATGQKEVSEFGPESTTLYSMHMSWHPKGRSFMLQTSVKPTMSEACARLHGDKGR